MEDNQITLQVAVPQGRSKEKAEELLQLAKKGIESSQTVLILCLDEDGDASIRMGLSDNQKLLIEELTGLQDTLLELVIQKLTPALLQLSVRLAVKEAREAWEQELEDM